MTERRGLAPAVLALGLVVGASVLVFTPARWACPLRLLAGIPCPACGITRATRLAIHGDFAEATRMHPLVWLVVPVVATFLAIEAAGFMRKREWGASTRLPGSRFVLGGTAALMFALWLARFAGMFGGPVE